MKNFNNVFLVTIIVLIGIIAIFVMLIASSINNNILNTINNFGFAVHPLYPAFESPESGFTINGNVLSASDDAVYKIGYYSVNGTPWQSFSLTGTVLGGNWLTGTVKFTLPNSGVGEHYVVIYSCSRTASNTWDCHDNKWQLIVINNTVIVPVLPSLSNGLNTFYIDTNGVDSSSRNGSVSLPWKTLAYACSRVTTSGSVIHINAGTYIETNECVLAVGVSIEGDGLSSVIKSHYTTTRSSAGINGAAIFLSSPNEGTNGNQHISNIKLDGDKLQGSGGILVLRRSNVTIHDCTIVDFFMNGITVSGTTNDYSEPSIYATGNQLYNNIISNCGDTDTTWNGGGLIEIGGQEGMLIHDNILNETGRAQGHNGDIMAGGFYNKGVKYYRNKSYKPDYDGDAWNFHLEIGYYHGGYEIYDNEFYGGDTEIDICGQADRTDDYAYSFYIHDNLFTGNPKQTENGKMAIAIEEAYNKDILIERNHFLNIPAVLEIKGSNNGPAVNKQIYFAYNILEKSGWNDDTKYQPIFEFYTSGSDIMSDIYIYNNVILGDDVTHTTAMKIENSGTISNFNVKNNIIENNYNGEFFYISNSGSINGLYVNNNILYNNANNNIPVFSGNKVSNYEFLYNINADPLFIDAANGNFHLKSNSPAINNGTYVGLTSDYEGKTVHNPPDIGAFEYP